MEIDDRILKEEENSKYLGIYLDKRLSWKKQAHKVSEKATKRLGILKRLAGSKWGCSRDVLNTTYKAYIKPVLHYGCEALVTSNESNVNKLEKVQNQAMRLITGAVKSTPVTAMQILTQNDPIKEDIRRLALIQYEKLKRLPSNNYWSEYPNKPRKLKTQKGFIQMAEEIKQLTIPSTTPESIPLPNSPLHLAHIQSYTNILCPVSKKTTSDPELKAAALETIHTRYPETEWIHVYTDGSYMQERPNAGAGVYSTLFNFYKPIGRNQTNFDGEMEAILLATTQLEVRSNSFEKVVILSDSKSAIQAITSHRIRSKIVGNIQSCIYNIQKMNKTIVLQWIPSHCDILGNEMADQLAKKGTQITQAVTNTISFHSARRIIINKFRQNISQTYREKSEDKQWSVLLKKENKIPEYPRRAAVAKFRMLTGHDCMSAHLNRLNLAPSKECLLCKKPETVMDGNHLEICEDLKDVRDKMDISQLYWEARRRMEMIQVP